MLFLFFSLFLSFLRNVPSGLPGGTFRFCVWVSKNQSSRRFRREEKRERKPSGCPFAFDHPPQRQNCKTELQNTFCNFEGSLAKDPKGLFDKLTVRLAGRYISFMHLGVSDCQKASACRIMPTSYRNNLLQGKRVYAIMQKRRWNIFGFLPSNLAKREGTTGAAGAGPQTQEERA